MRARPRGPRSRRPGLAQPGSARPPRQAGEDRGARPLAVDGRAGSAAFPAGASPPQGGRGLCDDRRRPGRPGGVRGRRLLGVAADRRRRHPERDAARPQHRPDAGPRQPRRPRAAAGGRPPRPGRTKVRRDHPHRRFGRRLPSGRSGGRARSVRASRFPLSPSALPKALRFPFPTAVSSRTMPAPSWCRGPAPGSCGRSRAPVAAASPG